MTKHSIIPSINNEGNALIIALLLIFAIGIISMTVVTMTSTDLKISGNQQYSTEALFAAEAGLTEAIHRVSMANPTLVDVEGVAVNIAISDSDPYDPNWRTYIQLAKPPVTPVQTGSVFTTGTLQDLSGDPMEFSRASGTDGVLMVEHKWEDRNGDGVRDANEIVRYNPSQIPAYNFTSGRPVEVISVTGRSGTANRSLRAEVARAQALGKTYGALLLDRPTALTGNGEFCGWNHNPIIPNNTDPPACFVFHLVDGGLPGVTSTNDNLVIKGKKNKFNGDPVIIDTTNSTILLPPLNETLGISQSQLDEILADADQTSDVGRVFNGVTYINGNANFTNSNSEGTGLLYITGDCNISGIEFRGLIYVEGNLKFLGNSWVLGAVMNKGRTDNGFAAGGSEILYSQEMLQSVLSSTMPTIMLSWREM